MKSDARCLGFLALAAGTACATGKSGGARRDATVLSPPAPSAAVVSPGQADSSAIGMDAEVAEYLRFHPSLWPTSSHAANARASDVRRPLALPGKARPPPAAKIRAYAWAEAGGCKTHSPIGAPFETDGAPCSGVVGFADLTREESATVQALTERMDTRLREGASSAVVACDFDPHHAFVYLDEDDSPIAIIEPCFACHQWRIRPSSRPDVMNDWEPPAMTEEERKVLGDILDAHHLGAWAFEEDSSRVQRVHAYLERAYGGYSMQLAAQRSTLTPRGVHLSTTRGRPQCVAEALLGAGAREALRLVPRPVHGEWSARLQRRLRMRERRTVRAQMGRRRLRAQRARVRSPRSRDRGMSARVFARSGRDLRDRLSSRVRGDARMRCWSCRLRRSPIDPLTLSGGARGHALLRRVRRRPPRARRGVGRASEARLRRGSDAATLAQFPGGLLGDALVRNV
jgi:hypothetical protein